MMEIKELSAPVEVAQSICDELVEEYKDLIMHLLLGLESIKDNNENLDIRVLKELDELMLPKIRARIKEKIPGILDQEIDELGVDDMLTDKIVTLV